MPIQKETACKGKALKIIAYIINPIREIIFFPTLKALEEK